MTQSGSSMNNMFEVMSDRLEKHIEVALQNISECSHDLTQVIKTAEKFECEDITAATTPTLAKDLLAVSNECLNLEKRLQSFIGAVSDTNQRSQTNNLKLDCKNAVEAEISKSLKNQTHVQELPQNIKNISTEISSLLESIISQSSECEIQTHHPEGELEVVSARDEQAFICPITLRQFNDPVKNKICNHSYEREAVFSMIKKHARAGFKCPNRCTNKKPIREVDLVANTTLRREIERSNLTS